jgi:hypothetical protein
VSNHGFDFDKSHNFDKTQAISPKAVEKIQNKPSGQNRMSASSQDFADFANFANFSPN